MAGALAIATMKIAVAATADGASSRGLSIGLASAIVARHWHARAGGSLGG